MFHLTLTYVDLNKDCIEKLKSEYNNIEINMEFEAKEIAILCCLSDFPKTSEFFTLKLLNIGS
jgi:2'-5' RNA ligase